MSTKHSNRKNRHFPNVGMRKHALSGVAHNHANSISRVREYNRELEEIKLLREKRKPKMYSSIRELFNKITARGK